MCVSAHYERWCLPNLLRAAACQGCRHRCEGGESRSEWKGPVAVKIRDRLAIVVRRMRYVSRVGNRGPRRRHSSFSCFFSSSPSPSSTRSAGTWPISETGRLRCPAGCQRRKHLVVEGHEILGRLGLAAFSEKIGRRGKKILIAMAADDAPNIPRVRSR